MDPNNSLPAIVDAGCVLNVELTCGPIALGVLYAPGPGASFSSLLNSPRGAVPKDICSIPRFVDSTLIVFQRWGDHRVMKRSP